MLTEMSSSLRKAAKHLSDAKKELDEDVNGEAFSFIDEAQSLIRSTMAMTLVFDEKIKDTVQELMADRNEPTDNLHPEQ